LRKANQWGQQAVDDTLDFLEEPFSDVGEKVGHVVGVIVFNVILLVATDAIGNLIKEGASLAARLAGGVAGKVADGARAVRALLPKIVEIIKWLGERILTFLADSLKLVLEAVKSMEELLGAVEVAEAAGPGVRIPIAVAEEAEKTRFLASSIEGKVPRGPTSTTVEELTGGVTKGGGQPVPVSQQAQTIAEPLSGLEATEEAAKAAQTPATALPKELEEAADLAPRAKAPDTPVTSGESVPYREGTTKVRGVKGDLLTPDHIPSRAAVVQAKQEARWAAEQARLERPLRPAEKEALSFTGAEKTRIRDEAMSLMKGEEFHKTTSRTFAGRNQPAQIALDAQDLTVAVEKDVVADLSAVESAGGLTRAKVAEYIQHYRNLVQRNVIPYSDRLNKVLLDFLMRAK
jgi:hypothetical protein